MHPKTLIAWVSPDSCSLASYLSRLCAGTFDEVSEKLTSAALSFCIIRPSGCRVFVNILEIFKAIASKNEKHSEIHDTE